MKLFIFLLAISHFTFSCKHNDKTASATKNFPDSLIRDIPDIEPGQKIAGFNFVRALEAKLGISDISNGSGSFQLRIWNSYEGYYHEKYETGCQLISVLRQGDTFKGNRYEIKFLDTGARIDTTISVTPLRPKTGWKNFTSVLKKMNIWTLPHMDDILDDNIDLVHPQVYTVELAEPNRYRLYQYYSPKELADELAEASQMSKILEYVEKEMDFRWN